MKTDTDKIARNTGRTIDEIQKIKNYLFIDKSLYDENLGEWRRFDPDCAIAQSWQRLLDGKNIQQHDLTLLAHELYEIKLREDNPDVSYREAHMKAQGLFDYRKESEIYYGNLE